MWSIFRLIHMLWVLWPWLTLRAAARARAWPWPVPLLSFSIERPLPVDKWWYHQLKNATILHQKITATHYQYLIIIINIVSLMFPFLTMFSAAVSITISTIVTSHSLSFSSCLYLCPCSSHFQCRSWFTSVILTSHFVMKIPFKINEIQDLKEMVKASSKGT